MPILGLTDRPPSFPELGILRKGGKKTDPKKPGPDLKYFRFACDDTEAEAAFLAAFGSEPTKIEVVMPFAKAQDCYESWMEEWAASSLIHRCNGKTCVLWLDRTTGDYRNDPIDCPGGCKQVGRLKVVIPKLQRLAYVTVLTTSKYDVMNIDQNLKAIEDAGRGSLLGIPIIVQRKPREISTPEEVNGKRTGKKIRRKKSLITLEAAPSWVALQIAAQQQAALPSASPLMIPAGTPDDLPDNEDYEPDIVDTTEPVKSIVPPDEPSLEEERLNKLLKKYCLAVKKTTPLARQFWQETYEKLTFEQKRQVVKKLKLEPPAEGAPEEVHEGEVVEETNEQLIEQIEGEIFKDLGALGIEPKDIISKIASIADGEIGLEDLTPETLKAVRDGLKLWRDQLRKDLKRKAVK